MLKCGNLAIFCIVSFLNGFLCDSDKAILHISQHLTLLTKQFVFAYVSMLKCFFFFPLLSPRINVQVWKRRSIFFWRIAFTRNELDVLNFVFVLMVAKSMRSFFTDKFKRNKGRFKYPWLFFLWDSDGKYQRMFTKLVNPYHCRVNNCKSCLVFYGSLGSNDFTFLPLSNPPFRLKFLVLAVFSPVFTLSHLSVSGT